MRRSFACSVLALTLLSGCTATGPDAQPADAAHLTDAGPTRWQPLPPVAGGPVQEIGVAELSGHIYVIGGMDQNLAVVDRVAVYDVAQNTWRSAAPLPMPVHHANVAASGPYLYVLGALTGRNFAQTGAAWRYDPVADAWQDLAPLDPENARGAAAVGVIDGLIYLAGGLRNGGPVADLSAYDPATNTWTHDLPPLPDARDHLVGAAVGPLFYVVSGRQGGISALNGRVDAYDPVAREWQSRAPIPTPRGGMAAAVVDGHIVVAGGEGSPAPSGVFPHVEAYDPATDQWTSLEPMRTPRHGMGAAAYQGILYVPGGATIAGFAAVDTFEAYFPEAR